MRILVFRLAIIALCLMKQVLAPGLTPYSNRLRNNLARAQAWNWWNVPNRELDNNIFYNNNIEKKGR
jgi:hypothetical protein